jgi:hypothetical protein
MLVVWLPEIPFFFILLAKVFIFCAQLLIPFAHVFIRTEPERLKHNIPYGFCRYQKLTVLKVVTLHVKLFTGNRVIFFRDVFLAQAELIHLLPIPFLKRFITFRVAVDTFKAGTFPIRALSWS